MIKDSFTFKNKYGFDDLLNIVRILRAPDGCPWDREQTHQSIRRGLIEESYEAVDAIDHNDMVGFCEELGDVLFQILFNAQIAEELGAFDMQEVCDGVCKKMIYRHPHVFADTSAETTEQVLVNWDKLKRKEKNQNSFTDTLKSVPLALPALLRAQNVQKRAAKAGFDWVDISGPLNKIAEETEELKSAIKASSNIEDELGDLLFSVVNTSRFLKLDAEEALSNATEKFIARFEKVEEAVKKSGKTMDEVSLEELDAIWDSVKSTL